MRSLLLKKRDAYVRQLEDYYDKLFHWEEQKARAGLNVPYEIVRGIKETRATITAIEAELEQTLAQLAELELTANTGEILQNALDSIVETDGPERSASTGPHPTAVSATSSSPWTQDELRQALDQTFDEHTLTILCFDHFQPIYRRFQASTSKRRRIGQLVDYCAQEDQLSKLQHILQNRA